MADETKRYIQDLLNQNEFNSEKPLSDHNPFTAYKNYIELIREKLESNLEFTAMQAVLKSMNPLPPKVYNPLTPFGPPPGGRGYFTDSLDVPPVGSIPKRDIIKEAVDGRYTEINKTSHGAIAKGPLMRFGSVIPFDGKKLEDYNKDLNLFSADEPMDKYSVMDLSEPHKIGKQGMKESDGSIRYDKPNFEALFNKKNGPDFGPGPFGFGFQSPRPGIKFPKTRSQKNLEARLENDDVFFDAQDFETGYVEDGSITAELGDDALYVPFFFQDLRAPSKRIYFRAFLTNFSESLTPEFNAEKTFGRVDAIPLYKGTARTFSIGWKIAAMSPAGFSAMWKKVNNLAKMMYPTYKNGVMHRAPVFRVRIGDVMADGAGRGLAGFASSGLELDYSNAPWETNKFTQETNIELGKGPMIIEARLGFTVIHEQNPGLDEAYNFNSRNFRRLGTLPDIRTTNETERNPSPNVNNDTRADAGINEED